MEDWTNGLTASSSNALKGYGFQSREEVVGAFTRGLMVASLGKRNMAEVRVWLGLRVDDGPPARGTLSWAIGYCEDHGYTVKPNPNW